MRNTLLSVLLLTTTLFAAEIRLLRHPSYHGGKIAFSYAGDIWVVNEDGSSPRRVTDHRARDIYPQFSPDGKWIAFSSNRYGNNDVFVIAATGGKAKRLTFHGGGDTVVGWNPDGKRVVFTSGRGETQPGVVNLYEVSVDGGLEQMVSTGWGSSGNYSRDGKQLAFTRHGSPWWRMHYRGSRAADLWVMDVAAKKFRKLSESEEGKAANWQWPMFAGGEIFFVSDRLPNERGVKPGSPEVMKSTNNIWKIPAAGGRPVQVTKHTSGRLFSPSISTDGKTIVYEYDAGLWKLDTGSGRTAEVKVNIETDEKENSVETMSFTNEADSYDLSPTTRRAAISIRGEIFTIATERGDVNRVTEAPGSRETQPSWSPDGKWIAFVSDRSGRDEVWICDEQGNNLKKLSDSDTEKGAGGGFGAGAGGGLEWSPDSKFLLFSSSDRKLNKVSVTDGKTEAVATGEFSRISNARFSPDGKWISYNRNGRDQRQHVYIIPATGGQEHRVTDDSESYSDTGAVWTRDGRYLVFTSSVTPAGIAQTGRVTNVNMMALSLQRQERSPTERDIDDEAAAVAAEVEARRRAPGGAAGGAPAPTTPDVKVDWDGITKRARRLSVPSGIPTGASSSPDGRTVAFVIADEVGGRPVQAIYTIGIDGQGMTRVAQAAPPPAGEDGPPGGGGFGGGLGSLQWSRDGRTIFYREGRGIFAVGVGGGAAAASAAPAGRAAPSAPTTAPTTAGGAQPRRLTFTARVDVDRPLERKEVFGEAWRIMKNRFYDSKMHGVDWAKVRNIYEPLLSDVHDTDELHNVALEMIGQLNASHTGMGGGGAPERGAEQTRFPGFDLAADSSGYYKVGHVYKDGPADHDYIRLKTGDFILAVDDEELKTSQNYWERFTGAPGRKFKFLVNSKPAKDGAWEVRIEGVSGGQQTTLQYERWVAERRAIVDKLSGGEIGYLHIRAMNEPSLRRFERELTENHLKKALVIDQRFNGGGGIEQELLQILQQRAYQYTRNRDATVDVSRPFRAFFGPMVVMENERSGSNAEMFPQGFKDLKLGKVVGVPSAGGVIGTGSYTLMDGSTVRTPGSGVWTSTGINMENYGVPPDILVDNTPEDYLAGRDVQIEKAVESLKASLKKGPTQTPIQ